MRPKSYTPSYLPAPRRRNSYFLLIPTVILALLAGLLIATDGQIITAKGLFDPTPPPGSGVLESLLYTQLPEKLAELDHANWVLDDVEFSEDKLEAMMWMAEVDTETGEVVASEPHVILALYDENVKTWALHTVDEAGFYDLLMSSTFSESELATRFEADDSKDVAKGITYGGYMLPWHANKTKSLTWSIGHKSCAPGYCRYAFDFADGTMFEILAAKGGYVYHWKDTCANGNSACTNSITLEDRSTTPWTYQIYLHLAKGSIPKELKVRGAYVWQGMKLGKVDDTGYSSGHHLHFMVVQQTTLNKCTTYCWGKSVDITFKDVTLNFDKATEGGRPRMVGEASWYGGRGQNMYTSQNYAKPGPYINLIFPAFR